IGIAPFGMTFIIISEGIDLSVGSQIALGTVGVAVILNATGVAPGACVPLAALVAGVVAWGLVGAVNGLVIGKFNIVRFLATLGTRQTAPGVAKGIGKEQTVPTPRNWLTDLMRVGPEPAWLLVGPGVWICLVLLILSVLLLKYTVLGRYMFAIGS